MYFNQYLYLILVSVIISSSGGILTAQTQIWTNPGNSYTNIDNLFGVVPHQDTYGPISVSNCTSLRFSFDFSFSLPWPNSGNMESSDECPFNGGCIADITQPLLNGCNGCWDFMYVEIRLDGTLVFSELIGDVGETRQSGNINWTGCTNGANNVEIIFLNQNWASDETNTFQNLILECWDAVPNVTISTPTCQGETSTLTGTIGDPNAVASYNWTSFGLGTITAPTSQNTTVLNTNNGDTYILEVTDLNGCTASSGISVSTLPLQDPTFILNDFCGNTSGTASALTPGGTYSFNPDPGDGATIDMVTGQISNAVAGTSYNVQYETPGPCAAILINQVNAQSGPIGVLSGSATLCPDECTSFSFSFSGGTEPYTLNLSASPPGFPLPPIPGVSAAQVFTICYQGNGPLPTVDLNTFTITIPTLFTGSGNLVLTGISDNSGCPGMASGSFSLTLTSGINIFPAGPLSTCGDASGMGVFDLTSLEGTLTGNNGSLSVSWYEDINLTFPIANPSGFQTMSTIVYASVSDGNCMSVPEPIVLNMLNGDIGPVLMSCDAQGSSSCTFCSSNNIVLLYFTFLTNDSYNVEVIDQTTGSLYSGVVSNFIPLTVTVANANTVFELLDANAINGCPNPNPPNNLVDITLVDAPTLDAVQPITICGSYTLPPITGTNLSGNENYYTQSGGQGQLYPVGTEIFNSQSLFIYDEIGGCFDEEIYDITITPLNTFDQVGQVTECDQFILDTITGMGVSNQAAYYNMPNGQGIMYPPGSIIDTSIVLYIFDPTLNVDCLDSDDRLRITILEGNTTELSDTLRQCSTDTLVFLDNLIDQNFVAGGIWTYGMMDISKTDTFNIASLPDTIPLVYTFSQANCGSFTLNYIIIKAPTVFAGMDMQLSFCNNQPDTIDLLQILGTVDTSGAWVWPTSLLSFRIQENKIQMLNAPEGNYDLAYTIMSPYCPADTAHIDLRISAFLSAGEDVRISSCINSMIDIASFVNDFDSGIGSIVNINNYSGFLNGIWNTSTYSADDYFFSYITNNNDACVSDTAEIRITLAQGLNAGNDISAAFCPNDIIDLRDFVDPLADTGGNFLLNGVPISNPQAFDVGTQGLFTIVYQVGDGQSCPIDQALLTLTALPQPAVTLNSPQGVLCIEDILELTIDLVQPLNGTVYLSASNGQDVFYWQQSLTGSISTSMFIETNDQGPFDFFNLPIGFIYSVVIDSVWLNNQSCVFRGFNSVQLNAQQPPTSSRQIFLCPGESITIEGQVFDENNRVGQVFIPSSSSNLCDTLQTVTVDFYPMINENNIDIVTCDRTYTLMVGLEVFDVNNTQGTVTLPSQNGCDSIVNVAITFNSVSTAQFQNTTCDSSFVYAIGEDIFDVNNPSGQVVLANAASGGCDSIITIDLRYLSTPITEINESTCDPTYSLAVGGEIFDINNPSGDVIMPAQAFNGCDSIVRVNIQFNTPSYTQVFTTTCDSMYAVVLGNQIFNFLNPVGQVILPNAAMNGCDSIIDVNLDFRPLVVNYDIIYDCQNADAVLRINLASQSGLYNVLIDGVGVLSEVSLPVEISLNEGMHDVVLFSVEGGCTNAFSVNVDDTGSPDISLLSVLLPNGGYQLSVEGSINSIYNIQWTPPNTLTCGACLDPIATPNITTEYVFTYNYSFDCEGSTSITVDVTDENVVFPNIIRHSSTIGNNTFYAQVPENYPFRQYNLRVYDRWGNLIFHQKNLPVNEPLSGWSGMYKGFNVAEGVYVYLIEFVSLDDEVQSTLSGNVTVLR